MTPDLSRTVLTTVNPSITEAGGFRVLEVANLANATQEDLNRYNKRVEANYNKNKRVEANDCHVLILWTPFMEIDERDDTGEAYQYNLGRRVQDRMTEEDVVMVGEYPEQIESTRKRLLYKNPNSLILFIPINRKDTAPELKINSDDGVTFTGWGALRYILKNRLGIKSASLGGRGSTIGPDGVTNDSPVVVRDYIKDFARTELVPELRYLPHPGGLI